MPRIVSFLAVGCTHFPYQDQASIDWVLAQIKKRRPDVIIHLGDMIDAESLSDHPKGMSTPTLEEEYRSASEFCAKVNDAAPRARKVWMMGNHEQRALRSNHAHISSLIDPKRHMKPVKKWKIVPYIYDRSGTYSLGQVTFAHGFNVGQSGCKKEVVQFCAQYGLYVYAHTHRPHDVHRISMGSTKLYHWHANAGTHIKPKPGYMTCKDDSLWGQAVVVGEVDTKRRFDGKQNWKAETVIRRMYWDAEVGAA